MTVKIGLTSSSILNFMGKRHQYGLKVNQTNTGMK
jgi:hypothetical protein